MEKRLISHGNRKAACVNEVRAALAHTHASSLKDYLGSANARCLWEAGQPYQSSVQQSQRSSRPQTGCKNG
eukprot:1143176-Pelagomonas_calceolata.AAC.2